MKYIYFAIIGIVLIAVLSVMAVSQGKRGECLQSCRDDGDACAATANKAFASMHEREKQRVRLPELQT